MDPKALHFSMYNNLTISQLDKSLGLLSLTPNVSLKQISHDVNQYKIKSFISGNDQYHFKFNLIVNKPKIIYYIGDISLLNEDLLAIVGPRLASSYAIEVLDKLFNKLKYYKLITISGMADGVDQYAHKSSIKNKIKTIAVLGGGLMYYINSSQYHIMQDILNNGGLILSQYKLYQEPKLYTFPERNRIIAGLSKCVFIPEASPKSGSLITADFAHKMSIPIYGTPNSILTHNSKGLLQYIIQNTINTTDHTFHFVDKHFQSQTANTNINKTLSSYEQKIISIIKEHNKININKLQQLSNIPTNQLLVLLTNLEIKQYITQNTPGIFSIK